MSSTLGGRVGKTPVEHFRLHFLQMRIFEAAPQAKFDGFLTKKLLNPEYLDVETNSVYINFHLSKQPSVIWIFPTLLGRGEGSTVDHRQCFFVAHHFISSNRQDNEG